MALVVGSVLAGGTVSAEVFDGLPEPYFTEVVRNLSNPVALVDAGDGGLYVVEQRGRIIELRDGAIASGEPFLQIEGRVLSVFDRGGGNEQGLLGMALPPGFGTPEKRHFYVYYTRDEPGADRGDAVIARFSLLPGSPLRGDAASEEELLVVDQAFSNHNGGDMHFGPDGFLYIGTGDGGSANGPGDLAPDSGSLLGKMLRLDVEGPGPGNGYAVPGDNPFAGEVPGRDEVWATGLRNPWRFSFDRATGDLWVADVGQGRFEEVSVVPAGTGAGADFGWDYYEGNFRNRTANDGDPIAAPPFEETLGPVFQYGHDNATGGFSVTGGVVYRGNRFPRLEGRYLCADFSSQNFWTLTASGAGGYTSDLLTRTGESVSAFGQDSDGEVYLADLGGKILALQDTVDSGHLELTADGPDASGMVLLRWGAKEGESYQVMQSENLEDWLPLGDPVLATRQDARVLETRVDTSDSPTGTLFFQVERTVPEM